MSRGTHALHVCGASIAAVALALIGVATTTDAMPAGG